MSRKTLGNTPPDHQLRAAMALHNAGNPKAALKAYKALLAQFPHHVQCLQLAAMANLQLGDKAAAKRELKAALRKSPDFAPAHNTIGVAYTLEGNLDAAIDSFAAAVRLAPNDIEAHLNLGKTCIDAGRVSEAVNALGAATRLNPNSADAQYWLGVAHKSLGNFEDGITALRRALNADPTHAGSWWQLADMNATDADDINALHALEETLQDNKDDRAKLCFTLYRTYERQGDRTLAFPYLARGNRQKRETFAYDVAQDEGLARRIIDVFSQPFSVVPKKDRPQGVRPIYIVGMNRSGTTLVEQILASHSLVHGGGELGTISPLIQGMENGKGKPFPEGVTQWRYRDVQAASARVLKTFKETAPDAPYVTDKMPANFLYVGLIKQIIPDALIIHCRRSLLDCCFANYRLLFTTGNRFSYDWGELVRYFRMYEKLMAHWDAVLPGQLLTVHYEDVISDLETQARRILDFCDLSWEDDCLSFHKTDRAVLTSSATQVRQPIYKTAIGRWQPYESDLRALLAEAGEDFDSLCQSAS